MTREQNAKAEELAARYGRCAVRTPNDSGDVLLVGMTDDVERAHLVVPPDGVGSRAATVRDIALADERARRARGVRS